MYNYTMDQELVSQELGVSVAGSWRTLLHMQLRAAVQQLNVAVFILYKCKKLTSLKLGVRTTW